MTAAQDTVAATAAYLDGLAAGAAQQSNWLAGVAAGAAQTAAALRAIPWDTPPVKGKVSFAEPIGQIVRKAGKATVVQAKCRRDGGSTKDAARPRRQADRGLHRGRR
jgi:hypothetical protein